MEIIRSEEIESALKSEYRQYLTGHLERAQPHMKSIDTDIEVGISDYQVFTADTPHFHPVCTEHGYVLRGRVKLLLLNEDFREIELCPGDYFVLQPGEPHATKNDAGTRVMFIKHPSTNDKTAVMVDKPLQKWMASWEACWNQPSNE